MVAGDDPRTAHMRSALLFAVLLHLLLLILMPPLPDFNLALLSREAGLNVFLRKTEEAEQFDQILNQPLPLPSSELSIIEPSLGSASPERGEDRNVSEQTPQMDSERFGLDNQEVNPSEQESRSGAKPSFRIDQATIKLFAQQEARRYVKKNPTMVERLKRSFYSRFNYKRHSKTESYKNRYGDYYVRSSSSAGDICFLQEQQAIPDDFVTNTVYFFRCGRKPQKIDLSAKD